MRNRLSDHIAEDRRLTIGDLFLEGEKGTIRLDGNGNIFFRKFLSNNEKKINYIWSNKGFAGDSVYFFRKYVIEQLNKNKTINNQIEKYLINIKIEEAIYNSNRLKKTIRFRWCRHTDSNRGPDDYKSTALPAELCRHKIIFITKLTLLQGR